MAGNFYENRFLDPMASKLIENGWAFLAPNTRGHDFVADIPLVGDEEKYIRIGSSAEIFEDCVKDIKCWVDLAESKGFKTIVLQGHSLGAVKVAYYLAQTQDSRVSKLILVSPPDMVGLAEQEKNFAEMVATAKDMVANGRENKFMPEIIWEWYHLLPKTYLNLTSRDEPVDVFNTYEPSKESPTLTSIALPILAVTGSKDDANIVPAEEAMNIIKRKCTKAVSFDIKVIDGAPHSYYERDTELAETIVEWLH